MTATPFLTADWRHLVMANWRVDPALLAASVPTGTELDEWGGATYVSIVAFQFRSTRVLSLSIPGYRNFEEINLRFYVRRAHPEGVRRGVVFLREIVPKRLIALIAHAVYHEPYVACPTRSGAEPPSGPIPGRFRYAWKGTGEWGALEADVSGQPQTPGADSLEAFIAEHYWGYNRQADGSTMEYRVEHPAWKVWQPTSLRFILGSAGTFDPAFEAILQRPPDSAFVADGSPVTVYRGGRLTGSGV